MFKKSLISFLLVVSINAHATMQNPFKLQTTTMDVLGYPTQYFDFYALKDNLMITEVIINRGKCRRSNNDLPMILNYGEKYSTNEGSCHPVLEIVIKTLSDGEWIWK